MKTIREYHEAVLKLAQEHEEHEVAKRAEQEIQKIDSQNARRQEKRSTSEQAVKNEETGRQIVALLENSEELTAKGITEGLGDESLSPQRVTAILRKLVDNGEINRRYPEKRSQPARYFKVE